jgi:8-oxo-dGTP pyrophosphatase MutT (NUDIX family)
MNNVRCVECGNDLAGELTPKKPHRDITIGCGVVVIDDMTRRFLILRRVGGGWWDGHLALVGGHPEEGEEIRYCVVRETLEETGLIVVPRSVNGHGLVFHTSEWISVEPYKHHFSLYVVADVVGGTLVNREPHKHADLQFVNLEFAERLVAEEKEDVSLLPLDAIRHYREQIGI